MAAVIISAVHKHFGPTHVIRGVDIAMVFQNYALYPHMTVRDNMSFARMLAKKAKPVKE